MSVAAEYGERNMNVHPGEIIVGRGRYGERQRQTRSLSCDSVSVNVGVSVNQWFGVLKYYSHWEFHRVIDSVDVNDIGNIIEISAGRSGVAFRHI